MIRGRTTTGGDVEFVDSTSGAVVASITADGVEGAVPAAVTAAQVTATAISPGSATTVQGILAELAARIAALETP
ncbi:hypothetical protein ACIQRW_15075 [Streptomyces sp. NPDC091287]|uniref:hypothetical protein n=1 Tax=Streptomyces sp. NPDC091287 TaxID=3365988 RepID=UPI00381C6061